MASRPTAPQGILNTNAVSDRRQPTQQTVPPGQQVSERILAAAPPIEAWIDKEKNEYHLSIAVPGVDPNELRLHIEGGNLTVQGDQQQQTPSRDSRYLQREFSRQRLHRTITLPESVDTEKISAQYRNGILEITAPLKESAASRQIQVNAGQQARRAGA